MKKLLGILGTITIAGSGTAGLVGNAPAPTSYEKQENNLEKNKNLNRSKRQHSRDISTFVTQCDLGILRPGTNGVVSNTRILDAFVLINHQLPAELATTSLRNRIIYVSANYGDRAVIGVYAGPAYRGYVQVTFNGGRLPGEEHCSSGQPSNWNSILNLSNIRNLNTNLGNIIERSERIIIQTFMTRNQDLPTELINILRVRNIRNGSATLYIPEGNNRYEGVVNVVFIRSSNYGNYHDEF